MKKMSSSRPYVLRAMYDWILDNEVTPHVVVDAEMPGVEVPSEYVEDGKIVLNIAPRAIQAFEITPEEVTFDARFHGEVYHIVLPLEAIEAIYASENGRGIMFDESFDADEGYAEQKQQEEGQGAKGKPNLRVIK